MALRTIRTWNDEILRKTSKPVQEITPRTITLLDDMAETMYDRDGVGLAAPQVGVLKRVVVIDTGDSGLVEMINPEIIEQTGEQNVSEGCLSMPGKTGKVTRPATVKARYLNRDGAEMEIEGTELLAVALCHEIDHLDGILYMDKAEEISDTSDNEYEEDDEPDQEDAI